MTYTIVSVTLMLFAAALLVCALLVPVAVLAGDVFHVWGTRSALEWMSEAALRIFAGGLRQRFMRTVNRQSQVGLDKSRRAFPYIAVSVSPSDVTVLAGRGGSLSGLAADAAKGFARYARAQGWASDSPSQLAVVPEEWLRRGTIKARSVSWHEFIELRREMHEWDEANMYPEIASAPLANPTTCTDNRGEWFSTMRLADGDAPTAVASEALTEILDSTPTVTMTAHSSRLVLADAEGVRHEVTLGSVRIGRGQACGVRLDSAEVSREHVNVYFQEGTWWLRDCGSRNGTTLNGQQVRGTGPVRLRSGNQIVLGCGKAAPKLTVANLVEV